jgi:hypothetical protein
MSARGVLVVVVSAFACSFAGCGGVISADLFIVERSGPGSQAPLSVLVSEEGVVHCDRGAPHRLSDPALIEARTLQEELHGPATRHLSLPPRPGSVYGYRVRDGEGSVSFADNSSGEPKVLERLQLFTLKVAQSVCHLPV